MAKASEKPGNYERSAYKLAEQLLQLIEEARSGVKLTVEGTMKKFSVQRAAASRYLKFVQRQAGLGARRRGSRKVVEHRGDDEALFLRAAALTVSVVALSGVKNTSFHKELRRMAADARGELDEGDQAELDRLFGTMFVKRREAERPSHYAATVDRLSFAIRHRHRCKVKYTKLDGATGVYLIEPWSLTIIGEALFVFGRKLPDGLTRSFEVTDIQKCEVTSDVFDAPSPYDVDLNRIFGNSIGTYDASAHDPVDVVLRVRGKARVLLQRRRLHTSQRMDAPNDNGWATATLRVWICPELVSSILAMLPEVVVIAPEHLREEVQRAARSVDGSDWDPSIRSGST